MTQRVAIRDAEFIVLALASVGGPYVLLQASSSALFLSIHGAAQLPYVYLAVAAISALLAWGFVEASQRFDLQRLVALTMLTRAAVAVGLKAGFAAGWYYEASFLAAVWARVDFALGGMALWALANQRYNVREAKRVFPLLALCDPIAVVAGGALIPVFLIALAPSDLLVAAAVVLGLGLPPLLINSVAAEDDKSRAQNAALKGIESHKSARTLSPSLKRYLGVILLVMLLFSISHLLLDNLYFKLAQDLFTDLKDLTRFVGWVLAASGLLSILVVLVARFALVPDLGVGLRLITLPVVVAALGFCALMAGWIGIAGGMGFVVLIIILKTVERTLLTNFHRPAFQTLFQPLPDTHRTRAIAMAEGFAYPAGMAAAALVLLGLIQGLSVGDMPMTMVLILLALGWIGAARLARLGYVEALERALSRRQTFEEITLGVADRRSREIVRGMIRKGEEKDKIGALRIQASLDPDGFRNIARPLIASGEAELVRKLVSTVPEIAHPDFYPPMAGRLLVEENKGLRGALLTAIAATGHPNSPRVLAKAIAASPENPPLGALCGLCRDGGDWGAAVAGQFLERYSLTGERPLRRVLDAISDIGPNGPSAPVAMGLTHDSRRIRAAAIRAAGRAPDPSLAPMLVARLADPRERRATINALSSMGDHAIDALAESAGDRHRPMPERIAAIHALGRLDETVAHRQIMLHLESSRTDLQAACHLALWRAGAIAPSEYAPLLLRSARAMMRNAAEARLAALSLAAIDAPLMATTLEQRAQLSVMRSIRAAGVLRPRPVDGQTRVSALFGAGRDKAYADELAENLLPRDLHPLLRILQIPVERAQAARLADYLAHEENGPDDWLGHILTGADWATDWIAALAIHHLHTRRSEGLARIRDKITATGPLAQETLARIDEAGKEDEMALGTIEKVLILKSADLFSDVPDEDLSDIAPYLASVYLDPDETVIKEGEMGDELYILVSGAVRVERNGASVTELSAGDVFGDLAALDPEPRAATVIATSPSHVLALSNEHLLALLESNVEIAAGIISTLVRRLRRSQQY
ncbi:MAG: Npt1/Npt2 family nucleotide transporter [Pseudomonadota bacterium]